MEAEQKIHIGMKAPNFKCNTTFGELELNDFKGKWLVFFSHLGDFTPVCTTEFLAFASCYNEFKELDAELLALSIETGGPRDGILRFLCRLQFSVHGDGLDHEAAFLVERNGSIVLGINVQLQIGTAECFRQGPYLCHYFRSDALTAHSLLHAEFIHQHDFPGDQPGSGHISDPQADITNGKSADFCHLQASVPDPFTDPLLGVQFPGHFINIRSPGYMHSVDILRHSIQRILVCDSGKLKHGITTLSAWSDRNQARTALWKTFLPLRIFTPSFSIASVTT